MRERRIEPAFGGVGVSVRAASLKHPVPYPHINLFEPRVLFLSRVARRVRFVDVLRAQLLHVPLGERRTSPCRRFSVEGRFLDRPHSRIHSSELFIRSMT